MWDGVKLLLWLKTLFAGYFYCVEGVHSSLLLANNVLCYNDLLLLTIKKRKRIMLCSDASHHLFKGYYVPVIMVNFIMVINQSQNVPMLINCIYFLCII